MLGTHLAIIRLKSAPKILIKSTGLIYPIHHFESNGQFIGLSGITIQI